MTFPIDKGVPPPPKKTDSGLLYPWDELQVGDSFKVPEGNRKLKHIQASLGTLARSWAKKHCPEARFVTRVNAKAKFVRIWRIK